MSLGGGLRFGCSERANNSHQQSSIKTLAQENISEHESMRNKKIYADASNQLSPHFKYYYYRIDIYIFGFIFIRSCYDCVLNYWYEPVYDWCFADDVRGDIVFVRCSHGVFRGQVQQESIKCHWRYWNYGDIYFYLLQEFWMVVAGEILRTIRVMSGGLTERSWLYRQN